MCEETKKNIIGSMTAQHRLSFCFLNTFAPPKHAVMACVATCLSVIKVKNQTALSHDYRKNFYIKLMNKVKYLYDY